MLGSALFANAQSGTNSPYSQYGLGVLSDQTSGFNRGMNGVGIGFHEHNQVNYLNPASYSSLDSLTFIFDVGASGQITNFTENGVKKNAKSANFEYAVAGFRIAKGVGASFGIIPYTNVGYSYSQQEWVNETSKDYYYTNTYSGEGGVHQAFVGAAWQPFVGFSFGANFSFVWGSYTKSVLNTYSNAYYKSLLRTYSARLSNSKFDFGVQYTKRLGKKDWLTLGVTFSPGLNIGGAADMKIISSNSQTNTADTIPFSIANAHSLPTIWGVGLMWNHNVQLKVGIDYTLQKWGSIGYPTFETTGTDATTGINNCQYVLRDGIYQDRHKVNLGVQYCYGERARKFLRRVQYRAGVSYATPYYKVNGGDGPKEFSVSAGFGIPIINNYNNRSFLNISGQWVRSSATGLIKENMFRINVGFTFNEDWFKKWKMQ